MKRFLVLLACFFIFFASPVQAHWDNDAWLMGERQGLQDWDSVLELECFLTLDDGYTVLIADSTGGFGFKGRCEDRAFSLRDRAEIWGRRLEVEILTPYELYEYYHKRGGYHAINKAVIGNEWWYVDKKADKLWHPLNLD